MEKILIIKFHNEKKELVLFKKNYDFETLHIGTKYIPFGDRRREGIVVSHTVDELKNTHTTEIHTDDSHAGKIGDINDNYVDSQMEKFGWTKIS